MSVSRGGDSVEAAGREQELLRQIREAGESAEPGLLDQVRALGPAVVPALIAMATDEKLHYAGEDAPEVWAPLHAIQLLGELEAADAVEPLLPLLTWDDDWLEERLPDALGRIGQPALAPLRALLGDRTQSLWTRARAARALARAANHHPELRAEAVDALVAQLAPAETQVPVDEEVNAYVVCELGDLEAKETEAAIRQAFREDRVDPRIVDANFILEQLGLPLEPAMQGPPVRGRGLHLWLTCTACGRTRGHDVEHVYCDTTTQERRAAGEETPYSEWIIPEPITCPRCGAVNQYELAPEAYATLTAELLWEATEVVAEAKLGLAGSRPNRLDKPIIFRRFSADGREMHPLEARDMYRERVAAAPEDVELRLRYSKVLSTVGERDEAERQLRAVLDRDPANVEAHLHLGVLVRDAGRRDEAHRLFERAWELLPSCSLPPVARREYRDFVDEALAELEGRGSAPGWQVTLGPREMGMPRFGEGGGPLQMPVRVGPKIGRNEPCPCGSGKKYKRCCGA